MSNLASRDESGRCLFRGRGSCIDEWRGKVLLIAFLLGLYGCATTQIQHAAQLGELGKAYAGAVILVGQEALDSSIDFSLSEIQKERAGGGFSSEQARSQALNKQKDILRQRQQLIEKSNQLVALFAEYLSDLEQFAKKDTSSSFGTAITGLVENISNLGRSVISDDKALIGINDDERSSLSKLSGLISRQVHGQLLAHLLERDAATIGTQLRLLSKILAVYSDWIRERNDMILEDFYRTRVLGPFAGMGELPASWTKDARQYLEGMSLSDALMKATAAGDRMERFWAGYLAGRLSISEAVIDLKDIAQLLQAVSDMKKPK